MELEPSPPTDADKEAKASADEEAKTSTAPTSLFGMELGEAKTDTRTTGPDKPGADEKVEEEKPRYRPMMAYPTDAMAKLTHFRSVQPLFGVFLAGHMGGADRNELLQMFEGVLEVPPAVARSVRVPKLEDLPPGPLATTRIDPQLLSLGLATEAELMGTQDEEEDYDPYDTDRRWWPLTLMEKLVMLFNHDYPGIETMRTGRSGSPVT